MSNTTKIIKIASAWLFALMVVVVAGFITVNVLDARQSDPKATVAEYLQALRTGDAATAMGILNSPLPSADPALLDTEILKTASEKITDVVIDEPQSIPNQRMQVKVHYKLMDEASTTIFELEPAQTRWMFFHSWRMVPQTLATLHVSAINQNVANVNGVNVPLNNGSRTFAVLFPGAYITSYESKFFQAPANVSRVVQGNSAVPDVSLVTAPTPELLKNISVHVNNFLDTCSEQTVLYPTLCPMAAGTQDRLKGEVKWKISKYPEVSVIPYGGSWVISPLVGTATATFNQQVLATGETSQKVQESNFSFNANFSIADDVVSVSFKMPYE